MSEESGTVLVSGTKKREQVVEPPKQWDVILLNDDYTPMEYVVGILMQFFSHNEPTAIQIMLDVHQKGRGVGGTYSRDIAETKATIAVNEAQAAGHPLQLVIREHE